MEMHPVSQRISLVSIPFVLVLQGKPLLTNLFGPQYCENALAEGSGGRLAQQSLSPVLNHCSAHPRAAGVELGSTP